jgi:putative flippase GtrA
VCGERLGSARRQVAGLIGRAAASRSVTAARRWIGAVSGRGRRHRVARFAVTGATVAVYSLAVMTVLVVATPLPTQVCLALTYATALFLHFTLNRRWVFASHTGYRLHLSAQGARYLTVALAAYCVTALALATIPGATGAPTLLVYYVVAATLAAFSFLALGRWVFAGAETLAAEDPPQARAKAAALGGIAVVAVIGAFYFWTALTSVDSGRSFYSLLAQSFADGRLDLEVKPPKALLALPDPYDPVQNAPYQLHDASLYKGHYYLYFGPTPAAVLYLPLRVVGVDVSDRIAAPLFATVGLAAASALLLFLIARYLPRTPTGWRLVGVVALGLGNVVPFTLRRPAVYEVAITAGLCFLMIAALLLVTAVLRDRPSLWRLAAGSLAFGLAVGARASLVLAAPLLLWAWWHALGPRRRWNRDALLRTTAAAAAPLLACLLLLGLYNLARFGSLTELGARYQLAGVNLMRFSFFEPSRILPGTWFYLLDPPTINLDFPFFHLTPSYPGTLPNPFFVEPVAGVLATTPLVAALIAAPAVAWRRLDRGDRELGGLLVVLVLIALLLPLAPVVTLAGATMRYEVDFMSFLLIAAVLAWLWLADHLRRTAPARLAVLGLGTCAIVFCAIANLGFSITGYYDGLRTAHPGTYAALDRFFGFVPTLAARIRGTPIVLESRPVGVPTELSDLKIAAPDRGLVRLQVNAVADPAIPPGSRLALEVRGVDGTVRRTILSSGTPVLTAALDRGLNHVTVRWRVLRYAGTPPPTGIPPAGYGLLNPRVVSFASGRS